MNLLNPLEAHLPAALALALINALVLRGTLLIMLAMVLRGSTPGERPALLDSFTLCLRYLSRTRHHRGSNRQIRCLAREHHEREKTETGNPLNRTRRT